MFLSLLHNGSWKESWQEDTVPNRLCPGDPAVIGFYPASVPDRIDGSPTCNHEPFSRQQPFESNGGYLVNGPKIREVSRNPSVYSLYEKPLISYGWMTN